MKVKRWKFSSQELKKPNKKNNVIILKIFVDTLLKKLFVNI